MRRPNNRLVTFGALILVTLTIIVVGNRSGVLRPLVSAIMAPLEPIIGTLTDGAQAVSGTGASSDTPAALRERNQELERTIAEMQIEIVRLREIEQDYYRLATIADYIGDRPNQQIVTGDVIAQDASSYLRWVIINRGTRDGVQVGDPAINELGLVGRVEDVAANASWILLANDPNSAVNARLQTARADGTIIGQLQGNMRMEFISQEFVIEPGDIALTSGLGGRFPPNIVIGVVTSVRSQQAALFQSAEIRPIVDFQRLEIVSIITGFDPVDPSLFDETIDERTPEEP